MPAGCASAQQARLSPGRLLVPCRRRTSTLPLLLLSRTYYGRVSPVTCPHLLSGQPGEVSVRERAHPVYR